VPPPPSPDRQRRSRLLLIVFLGVILAVSILATVLILTGQRDTERQERYRELREQAG
jgi:Tfp pilus assembly protein PilN